MGILPSMIIKLVWFEKSRQKMSFFNGMGYGVRFKNGVLKKEYGVEKRLAYVFSMAHFHVCLVYHCVMHGCVDLSVS